MPREGRAQGTGLHTCVRPCVGPEVAGLVEALAALHAHQVSRVGLRPGCPCSGVAWRGRVGMEVKRQEGEGGGEEKIVSPSDVSAWEVTSKPW